MTEGLQYLRLSRHDSVAVVALHDEARRNALSPPMVTEIISVFDDLEADPTVGAVVVTGTPPAFCSGADVRNLTHLASEAGAQERTDIRGIYEGFLRILDSTLPTVAAVNGAAVGAGFNVVLACDVCVAGTTARFDSRFTQIGLHPGGGHTWLLERAVGPRTAAALVLFGDTLDARDAVARGLARSMHDDADLLDAATELAARAARIPAELRERAKSTLRSAPWQPSFDSAVDTEVEHQTWSFAQGWFSC